MPDRPSPRRDRRAAPARDILASQVREEELPDVARPQAPATPQPETAPARDILASQVREEERPDVARPPTPAPPQPETAADPRVSASADAKLVDDLTRSMLDAGRLPLRVSEAALESQLQAIDGLVVRGMIPAPLVPTALVMKAQIRMLFEMVRAASGSPG